MTVKNKSCWDDLIYFFPVDQESCSRKTGPWCDTDINLAKGKEEIVRVHIAQYLIYIHKI